MSIPYMPLYVADYVGDTQHLSTEQHGAYLLLLMALWRGGGRLPNDPVKIARIVRLSPSKWGRIADDVMAFFTVDGGEITQKRLAAEIEKASKKSQVRSEAGKAGAEAKALKNNKQQPANAIRLVKHSPEPEPIEEASSLRSDEAPDDVRRAFDAFNAAAAEVGWPTARSLDARRRKSLRARLGDCGGLDGWRDALARARASPFLAGANDRGWRADLDFFLTASKFTRLLEGGYDDKSPATTARSQPRRPTAHDNLIAGFAAVARRHDPGGGLPDEGSDASREPDAHRGPTLDLAPGRGGDRGEDDGWAGRLDLGGGRPAPRLVSGY